MKKIYRPDGARDGKKLPVEFGGTRSGRKKGAVENLGLVATNQAGQPEGPVLLDSLGVLNRTQRPAGVNDPSAPSLNGPLRLYATFTAKYAITNYDAQTSYVVSATMGTVSRMGEVISYTAGGLEGAGSITVNGIGFPLTIDPIPIAAPIIAYPTNSATGLLDKLTVTTSLFTSTQPDTHQATDWEIATDATFATIVKSSLADTVNKISWPVTGFEEYTNGLTGIFYSLTVAGGSNDPFSSIVVNGYHFSNPSYTDLGSGIRSYVFNTSDVGVSTHILTAGQATSIQFNP